MARVLESPVACRQLLTQLQSRLESGQLAQTQWEPVRAALLSLAATNSLAGAPKRYTGWVTVRRHP